mmetsp:Transcript_52501/g.67325  ORF Transcript_52501/g.67325 Transcript_52501/m.67325 type:complete len:211 (-) Transcript_52501:83-715(-)
MMEPNTELGKRERNSRLIMKVFNKQHHIELLQNSGGSMIQKLPVGRCRVHQAHVTPRGALSSPSIATKSLYIIILNFHPHPTHSTSGPITLNLCDPFCKSTISFKLIATKNARYRFPDGSHKYGSSYTQTRNIKDIGLFDKSNKMMLAKLLVSQPFAQRSTTSFPIVKKIRSCPFITICIHAASCGCLDNFISKRNRKLWKLLHNFTIAK